MNIRKIQSNRLQIGKIAILILLFVAFFITETYSQTIHKNSEPTQFLQRTSKILDILRIGNESGTEIDKPKQESKTKSKVQTDSTKKENRIEIRESTNNEFILVLELKNPDQRIKVTIWNMLGKKVIDDYEGPYKNLDERHVIKNTVFLPKGVYLCNVQGQDFRLDAKFIVVR